MDIQITTCTTENELQQILDLQKKNRPANLSSEEKAQEGFVTVSHTLELLSRMNAVCPHIGAKDGDVVVGYALCMHPNFGLEIEILKPMIAEINSLLPPPDPYIIMGQICIDKEYRKMGIFRKLYEAMKDTVQPKFTSIITEVDTSNPRSLNAHYAVGFTDLRTYVSGKYEWKLIELQ
ncbi:GNAT family N-acetyltransferase [Arenibacter latericius]|uniref:GNAT family N-acetyltransferase n=1 Tax=Arenibacter latericius TaxID=86104 RepID=UPI0003F73941|nr:GNAT family N-acetyltransferase [Arenibacter latericius]